MKMRLSSWLLLMSALLSGCAQSPVSKNDENRQLTAVSKNDEESRQLTELLAWSQRVAQSTPDAQKKALGAANQGFAKDPGTLLRLRLAVLLAQPGAIADDNRAAALLEPFAGAGAGAGPLRQFGSLLQTQVNERIKEQKRSQQYREQIDALRNLERSLRERGQGKGK
jgi:hypothetical protein